MPSLDPNGPQTLFSASAEAEATVVAAALMSRGLAAWVVGGGIAGFKAEAPTSVCVVVRRRDFARARALLEEIQSERPEIDWSAVDVGEGDPEVVPFESHPNFRRALAIGSIFGLVAGVLGSELRTPLGVDRAIFVTGLLGGALGAWASAIFSVRREKAAENDEPSSSDPRAVGLR